MTKYIAFLLLLAGCLEPGLPIDTNVKDVRVNYVCSPLTCTGCCSNNICRGGNDSDACGYDGRACRNCANTDATCEAPGTCIGHGSLPHYPTPDAGCFVVEGKLLCR